MKIKRCLFIIGGLILLEGITLLGLSVLQFRSLNADGSASAEQTSVTSKPAYKGKKQEQKVLKIYEKNKNTLILVNANNPLKKNYHANLRPICSGRLYASQVLYDSLTKMLKAAGKKGYQYWIASARLRFDPLVV